MNIVRRVPTGESTLRQVGWVGADLAKQAHLVAEVPGFGDPPLLDPPQRHFDNIHGPTGSRDPVDRPGVGARHPEDAPNLVVFGGQLEQDVAAVSHRLVVHASRAFMTPQLSDMGEPGPMADEVGCEEWLALRHLGLTVCGHHGQGLRLLVGTGALGGAEQRDMGMLRLRARLLR